MNLKSIGSTADQKLNKWDFISVDSAKNMEHERKMTNKIFNERKSTMNKTIKQKMFLTNRKSFQHQPMRKRRQYQNFQKNWDKKWNDQNLGIQSLAPIGSLLYKKDRKLPKTGNIWHIRRETDPNQSETNTEPDLNKSRISRPDTRPKTVITRSNQTQTRLENSINKILFSSNSADSNFEPPPAARPTKPEVKSKPAGDITDINFSGILGSNTVLRQHCEQCVLRDKPEDFRSVLFVCQL